MALNVKQVYDQNPSTTAADNDLIYLGKSPYQVTDDSAITQVDYLAQLQDDLDFIHTTGSVSLGDIPVYGADGKNAKSSGTNISVTLDATGFKSVAVTQDPVSALQLATKQYVDNSVVAVNPLTTKGDVYTYSTVPARLPVGANGTIITADSAQSTGNKWTTATYPSTTTINQILYSSSANTITGLVTANNGVLATSSTGVPSIDTNFKVGTSNTVMGNGAGSTALFSQTATQNVAIGVNAGLGITGTGQGNHTLVGYEAGKNLTNVSGQVNITAVGNSAALNAQNINITAVGVGAAAGQGGGAATGAQSVAIGANTLGSYTSGSFNTCVGDTSATSISSGSNNTNLGYGSLTTLTTGSNNTIIGSSSDVSSSSASNRIALGYSINVNADNKMVLGNTSITAIQMANTSYPASTTINQILYSSAANTIAGLATANNGVLVTSNTGVPSILVGPGAAGRILQSNTSAAPSFSSASYPSSTTANQILYSSATNTVAGLTGANSAVLVTNSSGVPAFSSAMTNGQVIIGSTGATPTAATLTAGSGISITNGAGTISIATSGGGMPTVEVTGTSVSMAVNTRYVLNNAGLVTATLPTTFAVGDVIEVIGKGAGGWKIAQNASQIIHSSFGDTTTGTGGSLASTNRYDCTKVVGITANTDLVASATSGTLTNV